MRIIKNFFIVFFLCAITGTIIFCGFAKVYLAERKRCMVVCNNDFAQIGERIGRHANEHACNENHEVTLQQNKILHHALTVQ